MSKMWLPIAELTSSRMPVLYPGEVESCLLSSVDIVCEENPNLVPYKSGLLTLTTHRIFFIPETSSNAVAIPLAAITHIFSSKKSIKSMFASPRVRFQVTTTGEGIVDKNGNKSMVVTLVCRGKSGPDPDVFVGKLSEAWRGRAWEASGGASGSGQAVTVEDGGSGVGGFKMPVVGVSGILRKEQEMWESTDKSLQDAFQDLNALMVCMY